MDSEDNLIVEALKIDWDHARHVETQRLSLATVYILAVLGAGFAALSSDIFWVRILGSFLGLFISIFCWAMTHKWNAEFVNQIQSADKCAKRLKVNSESSQGKEVLHSYIGFPKPDPLLPKAINVRRMFDWFYRVFIIVWLLIIFNVIFVKDVPKDVNPGISSTQTSVEPNTR
jgi:hypothetical protein